MAQKLIEKEIYALAKEIQMQTGCSDIELDMLLSIFFDDKDLVSLSDCSHSLQP